jgi:flagellar basal body-associated protein FliL
MKKGAIAWVLIAIIIWMIIAMLMLSCKLTYNKKVTYHITVNGKHYDTLGNEIRFNKVKRSGIRCVE